MQDDIHVHPEDHDLTQSEVDKSESDSNTIINENVSLFSRSDPSKSDIPPFRGGMTNPFDPKDSYQSSSPYNVPIHLDSYPNSNIIPGGTHFNNNQNYIEPMSHPREVGPATVTGARIRGKTWLEKKEMVRSIR